MLVRNFFLLLVFVMWNKFLTKRPKNRLLGIVIYCSFLAYRCYMSRGVLRQMLNCPVNFTHIYCTVPISRASFSAIENTETRTYQSLRLGKNLNKLREAGWNSLAGYKVFSRVRYSRGYINRADDGKFYQTSPKQIAV